MLFLVLWIGSAAMAQHLLISELLIDHSADAQLEFIEITNPSGQSVSLETVYLADYANYYNLVNNSFTTTASDFCIRFPAGSQIAAGQTIVIANSGTIFRNVFGKNPDFEIFDSDSVIPDMVVLSSVTTPQGLLGNSREMVILFTWDGNSDLVRDLDYVTWGSSSTTSRMDKTGISVDGPDADSDPSAYAAETPIADQKGINLVVSGKSYARLDYQEDEEKSSGGNGIDGHDETSENMGLSFAELNNPTPGEFGLGSVFSGSGLAEVFPASAEQNQTINLEVRIKGEFADPLPKVGILLPSDWSWNKQVSSVSLDGSGFSGASVQIVNDTIMISGAAITLNDSGVVTVSSVKVSNTLGTTSIGVFTAISGESLRPIKEPPVFTIKEAPVPIDVIQQNYSQYAGKTVRVRGIVVLGAGKTTTSWTSAYIADETGAGINIYRSGSVDPDLTRGNLVEISGTVTEFQGVTEITNYSVTVLATNQKVPEPLKFSTQEVNNLSYEGYWVEVEGVITDYAAGVGGGTNITIDDGSGAAAIRVWDVTGVNTTFFKVGDTIVVRAPIGVYQSTRLQLLLSYQEDIRFKNQNVSLADGSGIARITPASVRKDSSGISMTLELEGSVPDTIQNVEVHLPVYWEWDTTGTYLELEGEVFGNAEWQIIREKYNPTPIIRITGASIGLGQIGIIRLHKLVSPAKDLVSAVFVKTAGKGGSLAFIKDSPSVTVGAGGWFPIRDLQLNSTEFSSLTVKIRGQVTIGGGVLRTDRTSAYVQDSSGYGINVNKTGLDTTNLKRNYFVEITGTVSEYQGVTQINPSSIVVLDTDQRFVQPYEITTQEANSGRWDGTLIKVYGVVIELYATNAAAGDYNVRITDGSSPYMVRVWGTTGIDLTGIEQGKTAIWVSGVGSIYREEYQMLPGYQDQIEIDENYKPSLDLVKLEIPPHPFVADRGELLQIRINAGAPATRVVLRIFDLAGREVITLLDESVEEVFITKRWNGRDQYNNLVAPGTYICLLEVLDPISGKKKAKRAPIVVGTMLR